jgi:aspartate dehydrogenase
MAAKRPKSICLGQSNAQKRLCSRCGGCVLSQSKAEMSDRRDKHQPLRVAVAGLGAIGRVLAAKLGSGAVPGIVLTAVAVRDRSKAASQLAEMSIDAEIVDVIGLPDAVDLVVECAPAKAFDQIARPMLSRGKKVMVLSVGALLEHSDLIELSKNSGGQIIVPTGALLGLDAVVAAAEGTIHSVQMRTIKPVKGLLGAPYLVENKVDITQLTAKTKVFEGTAREAAKGFPANLNVAVALSLAGIGPDRTTLEIWADPDLDRNTHEIIVDADSASFAMTIRNVPSDNPKTGRITPLSAIAALRKLTAPLRIGS